ncbi:unnamed protein product [Agarophyton chilense]
MAKTTTNGSGPSPKAEDFRTAETLWATTSAFSKPKRKGFRFIKAYDMVLLRAVRLAGAHIAEHGQSDRLYQEVHKTFMEHVTYVVFKQMQEPSFKTLVDRFKRVVAQRREYVKVTSRASGITEKYGEKKILVDYPINEMDVKQEAM